ncbi:MAG: hypothetical protein QM586_11315 [Xenophilus sp.]
MPEGAFDGPAAFGRHVHAALAAAAGRGWSEIVLSDPDFADWPLGERAVVEALQAWAAGGRSLKMLAHRFDVFERRHARFVHWRRLWDHVVQCRALPHLPAGEVPSGLWTPGWFLSRIDLGRSRGVCGAAAADRAALRRRLDGCLQAGRPAFPASVPGL